MQDLMPKEARELAARVAEAAFWGHITDWQFRLYFIAFAIFCGLLAAFCFLPEHGGPGGLLPSPTREWRARLGGWLGRVRWQCAHAGLLGLLALCCLSQQTNLDERRGFIADQDKRYEKAIRELAAHRDKEEVLRAEYLYLPEGNSLAYLSLGNTSLAADYLWLTSQQYVSSSFRRGHKFELLLRIYEELIEMDPHWTAAAINAGKVLSALEPDRYAVERFYIKSILKNPDNLDLPYEAGRLFVVPPLDQDLRKDYSRRAVEWFKEVLGRLRKLQERRPSESIRKEIKKLEDTTSRLALESGSGYYEAARDMLWERAKDKEYPEAMRSAAARDFLCADSLVLATRLQEAVNRHKAAEGSFPADLRPLVQEIKGSRRVQLDSEGRPLDAYGFPIRYDLATGTVASMGVQARRAIIAASVVNSLIEMYRGAHNGDPPKDLKELHAFAVEFYSSPLNRPGPAITDALGMNLNTTASPLGTPWEYDTQSGKVKLPGFCDPKALFRNAENILGGE